MCAPRIHIVLLFALCSSCSRDGKIDGQIFIVTEGRENIKLALVDIRAIRESDFSTYLRSAEKDKQSELQRAALECERFQSAVDRARADSEAAEILREAAYKTFRASHDPNSADYKNAKAAYYSLADQSDKKAAALKNSMRLPLP